MSVLVGTGLLALVVQHVVGALIIRQSVIGRYVDVVGQSVEVGTVVVNVQLAEAIDERQVTVAVESAVMLGADGDEVAVIHVAQGCRGVAKDRGCVGKQAVGARRDVTSGEYGVVYLDTRHVELFPDALVC